MRWARVGGAWLGARGQLRTQTCWSARMGVSVVIIARGEGVNVCCAPPPPSRIARRPPKARIKLCLGLYIQGIRNLCDRGARGGRSMVIAAWGEGVGVLVSPSPSSNRSSTSKTRVKIAGWVLGHAPSAARARAPPHYKDIRITIQ